MQLNPWSVEGAVVVGVTVFVGVGVTDPVALGDGVGVMNGEMTVNDRLALRCVTASLAWMVCCPAAQVAGTFIVTVKAPSLPALIVLLLASAM